MKKDEQTKNHSNKPFHQPLPRKGTLEHAKPSLQKKETRSDFQKQKTISPPPSPPPETVIPKNEPIPQTTQTEESIDLSAEAESSFNPYLFSREPYTLFLPLFMLFLLGLHLLPLPRRKRNKKVRVEQFLDGLKKEVSKK